MAQQLDAAAEAAEFAALVAELKAPEVDDDSDDNEAAPEAEVSGDPEEDEEEELDEASEEDELTVDETAAKALFEAGDIQGACKKLGLDPKIFKVNSRQFTAMRKGLADAAKLEREGRAKEAQGQNLHKAAEQTYGPIVAGFQAYKQGNPLNLRAAIELMCEDTFENVVSTVARAAKGLDPAQLEVIKLRKELAEREAKQNEQQTAQSRASQETAEVGKLTGLLKATPLAHVEGAAEEIRSLVVKSWDGTGYGLTVKQAYTQVKAKHAKIAAAFGNKPTGKPSSSRAPLTAVRSTKPTTKADREAAERAEFEAVLREAKDATKAGERKVRRAR